MAVLIGMSAHVKGFKYPLDPEEVFIGRNSQNHVPVDDTAVSGRHCSIVRDGHKYTLVDLGSTNGTRLNGNGVNKSPLKPKDIIQVGSVEFMFDGQDVDSDAPLSTTAKVEVLSEPVTVPETFHTASPFGSKKDSRKPWAIATGILVVLVAAALIFFLTRIFGS